MTLSERKERNRLHHRWATGKASMPEMSRCMELNRKAEYEAREAKTLENKTAPAKIVNGDTPEPSDMSQPQPHKRNELPPGATLIDPPIQVKPATWIEQTVDASIVKNGVTWYRVKGGFGNRGNREDWIADLPVSVSVHDYHWNGEDFGPSYETFDNACVEELKRALEHTKFLKAEAQQKVTEAQQKVRNMTSAIIKITLALQTQGENP